MSSAVTLRSSSASGFSGISKPESDESNQMMGNESKLKTRMAYRRRMMEDMKDEKELGIDDQPFVRRSSRQRKTFYENMNEGYIESNPVDHCYYNGVRNKRYRQPMRRGRRSFKGIKEDPESQSRGYDLRETRSSKNLKDNGKVNDMYSEIKARRSMNSNTDPGAVADTEETEELSEHEADQPAEATSQENNHSSTDATETESLSEVLESRGPTKYCLRPKRSVPPKPDSQTELASGSRGRSRHHHRHRHRYETSLVRTRRRVRYRQSSSSDSSSSEGHFERRKSEKMQKARNRCLPMNLGEKDLLKGIFHARQKAGTSLADIDPMTIDKSILFDSIGGLDEHVKSLKEMIVFPLLYPEVFAKYKMQPPRGVLFHGPPGTGKTLVARALANECGQNDRKVAFFMRKGADCLSKWVGESERQLRLLFDQAYLMRPSIIFFDEIDGIAPVRSTRQDQIHSSIVSTLLALMDGLDDRGEVVVIGATNRIEAIDPALRRPGRFDREFFFPLPSLSARATILSIHTKEWKPLLPQAMVKTLAALSSGYCGADLRALCGEAALTALKRRYPQIYKSRQKLVLNTDEIVVRLEDFLTAIRKLVPSSHRSISSCARPLSVIVKPLLNAKLSEAIEVIKTVFPAVKDHLSSNPPIASSMHEEFFRQEMNGNNSQADIYLHSLEYTGNYRPRLLIHGEKGQGQSSHLGPALLHHFENVHHIRIDLTSLFSVATKTPEESLSNLFLEANKKLPSIIYMPRINQWWSSLTDTVRATLQSLIEDIEPNIPVLILGTSDCELIDLSDDLKDVFDQPRLSVRQMAMANPSRKEREEFFKPLFKHFIYKEPTMGENKAEELLPVAPPPEPRKFSEKELKNLRKKEESMLRELRLFLRDVLNKLIRDKRFSIFVKPVDLEEVPDYLDVVKTPMSLETMMAKIDTHQYETAASFLKDVELICHNALEYNPDRDPTDKLIRHRACTLCDVAYAIIDTEMLSDFEDECKEIERNRLERGEIRAKCAPPNYKVITVATAAESTTEENPTVGTNNDEDTEIDMQSNEELISVDGDKEAAVQTRKRCSRGQGGRQQQQQPPLKKLRSSDENNDTRGSVLNGKRIAISLSNGPTVSLTKLNLDEVKAPAKEIVIDRKNISGLMEKAVFITNGCPVEQLEELYSSIYRLISEKQNQWNRSCLEKEIAAELDKFERLKKN